MHILMNDYYRILYMQFDDKALYQNQTNFSWDLNYE